MRLEQNATVPHAVLDPSNGLPMDRGKLRVPIGHRGCIWLGWWERRPDASVIHQTRAIHSPVRASLLQG